MTASASPDALLEQLTVAEQVDLLAGVDFWHTAPVERLGIPSLRVSDGPAGARGTRFDGPASLNVPCGTALAASWDPALVELIGALLGRETRAKGAGVLLAPTVNLHRTPIGGRNFECMSEDPHLTARTAVAYIRGLQSEGVASCVKHFVGNDTEFERMSIDSQIDERTLRELYLVPFEAAVAEAGVLAVMTGYNRINGPFAADSQPLIGGVLRGEWGFDGLVMSDWFGLHSTVEALAAGLDLEMPGPTRFRGETLLAAIERGDVTPEHVNAAARNVLTLMDRVGVLRGDGPGPELTRDDPDDRALIRAAGASGMVLLRNERGANESPALPLAIDTMSRVAVLGPNAAIGQVMGGGSAHVTPTEVIHPLAALTERLAAHDVELDHQIGCLINRRLPALDLNLCGPLTIGYFGDPADLDRAGAAPALATTTGTPHMMWVADPLDRGGAKFDFGARLSTTFTPDATGDWRFGVESVAPARLLVDGDVVLDNADMQVGGSFFGTGRAELTASIPLVSGRAYRVDVEVRHRHTGMGMSGVNIGSQAPVGGDLMADAVDAAAAADVAIVVVGTNDDWESEGWDRTALELPGQQDELIRNVAAVNGRTIVVINAGSPVAMPWLDEVAAVLVAWFPGQEMGAALVDVLFGDVEPQGRLPVTFPRRLEDTPAFEHHPGRHGTAPYLERRLMGYRWYDTVGREPLFPFGHGLGYADVSIAAARSTDPFTVEAELSNSRARDGVTVVQVYVHRALHEAAGDEPAQRLVGFAKVDVPGNGSATATITLDPRTYMTWDVDGHRWVDVTGEFELRVGTSSRQIAARLEQSR
jgi:beta-glucosidase